METWKNSMKNDFEDSVFKKFPEIAAIKDELYDLGAVYAAMSGSGSSVYGIFKAPIENVEDKFCGCFADRERWNSVADQWLVISGLRCHAAGINH